MSDAPLRTSIADELGSLASKFASPRATHELPGGTTIASHFVIETALGRGGMGVVYRAHDRRLDRRVAIKLGLRGADLARARREAVALARLAHPNVVTIHEIGEHEGVPFVAMELCEGGTVRAWVRAAPRTWREIVAVYLDAARGLAAAHAAGLVHRDVKPDNILLGTDGRARIADFGLARGAAGLVGGKGVADSLVATAPTVDASPTSVHVIDVDAATVAPSTPVSPSDPDSPLTADGAIVGTPRYMAPEQQDGRPLDARTDEYAFCVALREALGTTAPRRVLAVVERGAAAEPDARFPTMDALIAALVRASRRPRWWIAPAAVAMVAALAATWWIARDPALPAGCESADARLRGVWDPATRAAIVARGAMLQPFVEAIDARVKTWKELRGATCRDVRRGGETAAAGFGRLQCLDQRLADLGVLVGYVQRATDARRVDELSGMLPSVDVCRDLRDLAWRAPQPDTVSLRAQVAEQRAQVRVATALGNIGRFDEALALIDGVTPRGQFAPLDAEVDYARADVLGERGDLVASKQAYRSAINLAASAHHPEIQVAAMLDLALTLAQENEELDARSREEIQSLLELAEATLRGVGGDVQLQAHLHGNRSAVRSALGDLDGGIADAREAFRIRREHDGPHRGVTINAAVNLGGTLLHGGHHREARDILITALADADVVFAPDHAVTRHLCDLLSTAHLRLGELAQARAMRERALAMNERVHGADSPELDSQRINLSVLLAAEGRFGDGIPLLEKTLASRRALGDESSTQVAMLRGNLAMSYAITGKLDQALEHAERSLAIFESSLGKDHPALVDALVSLAMIHNDRGDRARAIATGRRAVALAETALPPNSPELANPLGTLSMILADESPAEARRLAERAITLAAPPDGSPAVRGEAQLGLAMALARLDQLARAVSMAEASVRTLTEAGPMAAPSRKRAEAWLAQHRAR
ncbi:MAG TPA: tetratricopeptide repeat protein [Kofleriaceae bacterium]|nr:tetratricopeptide repeat protein [Kofleriaceae bacterium]